MGLAEGTRQQILVSIRTKRGKFTGPRRSHRVIMTDHGRPSRFVSWPFYAGATLLGCWHHCIASTVATLALSKTFQSVGFLIGVGGQTSCGHMPTNQEKNHVWTLLRSGNRSRESQGGPNSYVGSQFSRRVLFDQLKDDVQALNAVAVAI